MKKAAIGALALAAIIGLTAASPIVTASAEAKAAREAEIWQAMDEKSQYIGDLITEQSNATFAAIPKPQETLKVRLLI